MRVHVITGLQKTKFIFFTGVFFFALMLSSAGFAQQRTGILPYSTDGFSVEKSALNNELENTTYTTSASPAGNVVNAIYTNGSMIWLGTSRGLSRSTDNGATWVNYAGIPEFGDEDISAITYDNVNSVLWVSTAHSENRNGSDLPVGSGLRFTSDGGETWNVVAQPIDNAADTVILYGNNRLRAVPITVAVQNIAYDIEIFQGAVWIATFAGGLRKSTDGGTTWERVVLPPDFLPSISPQDTLDFCISPVGGKLCAEGHLNYRVFSITSSGDSVIYVGTANGVNKSTDGGISWVKFNHQNQSNPVSGNFIVGMAYNDFTGTVLAASWKAEDQNEDYGVSFSSDGGANWDVALLDERPHTFGIFENFIVAASDNGAFLSSDGGSIWSLPGSIVDSDTKLPLQTSKFYSAAFTDNGSVLWLGSEDGLVRNEYEAGFFGSHWNVIFATAPLSSVNETYAFPNPFSPRNETVKIKYSTNGKKAQVTIRVYDFGMNYIRTIIQDASRGDDIHEVRGGDIIDFWDGKDDAGAVVPNGVYFYRIEINGSDPSFGKIMVVQ